MKSKFKLINILVASLLSACGGGGGDEAFDFNGTWSGDVTVSVNKGDPVCQYFSGSYPISYTLRKVDDNSYDVYDGDFILGNMVLDGSKQVGTLEFPNTLNHIDSEHLECEGEETVIFTGVDSNSITWTYTGTARCATREVCEYSGETVLLK